MSMTGNDRIARLAALLIVGLAACTTTSPGPTANPLPQLGISNGTTLTVTLVVNGRPIGDFPPRGPAPTIDVATLPALPWTVEARSSSGRVLTSMEVSSGQVWRTTDPDGAVEHSGTFGRVDLSCGRLTIWSGNVQPSGPAPAASPGTVGDCLP